MGEVQYGADDGNHRKKIIIICIIVAVCVVVAIILLISNLYNELSDLHTFHQGFEGRQLMMEVRRSDEQMVTNISPGRETDQK